jgi:hypothetical protein
MTFRLGKRWHSNYMGEVYAALRWNSSGAPLSLSLFLSFSVREEEEEEEENGHQIQMNFVSPLKNKRTKEPRGRCG